MERVLKLACGMTRQGVPVDLFAIKADAIFFTLAPPLVGIVDL
ncbi:hypothetical protein [Microseira sp. BLCC-F43]